MNKRKQGVIAIITGIVFLVIYAAAVAIEEGVMSAVHFCGFLCVFGFLISFAAFAAILANNTLIYDLKCRRAAIKALGSGGLGMIARDKVAKIAYKGILLMIKGRYAQSEEQLMRALSLSDVRQNQLFCVEWLVRLYEATSDDERLLWCYKKAVDYAPEKPELQSRLGHAYYVDGRLDEAMFCFQQALHFDPNHHYSEYSIAKIYIARGEDDKAIELLTELSHKQENHPLVYAELATILAMKGEEERSRECYQKAVLLGYNEPDKLARRMRAICAFNNAEDADGSDLPAEYYRHISSDSENSDEIST